jgi:hypothetical protein
MKPFVRIAALSLSVMFITAAAFAWFDVLTHENVLTNPELKIAGGWLMTGLMLLALGIRGWRRRRNQSGSTHRSPVMRPPT